MTRHGCLSVARKMYVTHNVCPWFTLEKALADLWLIDSPCEEPFAAAFYSSVSRRQLESLMSFVLIQFRDLSLFSVTALLLLSVVTEMISRTF